MVFLLVKRKLHFHFEIQSDVNGKNDLVLNFIVIFINLKVPSIIYMAEYLRLQRERSRYQIRRQQPGAVRRSLFQSQGLQLLHFRIPEFNLRLEED